MLSPWISSSTCSALIVKVCLKRPIVRIQGFLLCNPQVVMRNPSLGPSKLRECPMIPVEQPSWSALSRALNQPFLTFDILLERLDFIPRLDRTFLVISQTLIFPVFQLQGAAATYSVVYWKFLSPGLIAPSTLHPCPKEKRLRAETSSKKIFSAIFSK